MWKQIEITWATFQHDGQRYYHVYRVFAAGRVIGTQYDDEFYFDVDETPVYPHMTFLDGLTIIIPDWMDLDYFLMDVFATEFVSGFPDRSDPELVLLYDEYNFNYGDEDEIKIPNIEDALDYAVDWIEANWERLEALPETTLYPYDPRAIIEEEIVESRDYLDYHESVAITEERERMIRDAHHDIDAQLDREYAAEMRARYDDDKD